MTKEEKRSLREQKELAYLRKEKAKPKSKYYLWYLLLILALIYIVDEIISNLQGNLITDISHDIFPDVFGDGTHNAIISASKPLVLVNTFATFILALSMFYKPLADRFGRKPFLFINTLGMGVSIAICTLARNSGTFFFYIIGFFLMRFFVTPDEQVVYIFETVPKNRRATTCSIIKGIAEFGLVFISIMRMGFMGSDLFGNGEFHYEQWRWVFLTAAIAAAVISLIALFFARETDPYLDSRIAYLEKTPEERLEDAKKQKLVLKKSQGGFFNGLISVFKSKQLLFICIATFLYTLASSFIGYYKTLMDAVTSNNTVFSNRALFIFPFTCGVVTIIYGFISDKIGRKITLIGLLSISIIAFTLYGVGLNYNWNEFLLGALIGVFLGSFWASGDTFIMMAGESAPTRIRASAMTAHSLFFGIGQALSGVLVSILAGLGTLNAVFVALAVTVPVLIASLVLLMIFVRETKNIEIEKVELEFVRKEENQVQEESK